uniref:Uncharacterized protein n=1 Tax=Eiseniibacteriota bacterium TaxID=2212470 RepID=A0A832MM40_UNCEI
MKRLFFGGVVSAAALLVLVGNAFAWHLCGRVLCDDGSLPVGGIVVEVRAGDGSFIHATVSTADGAYCIALPDAPAAYTATLLLYNGEQIVSPPGGLYEFSTNDGENVFTQDWIITSEACGPPPGACWLTAGGAKFSPITGTDLGESTKLNNFGGNVYPGCSPTAGDGGQWNHIANELSLHFKGWEIQVLRCGNVEGIPPGSTSPVTPYNFIEFTGTGTLRGIKGNKADYGTVHFFARCEDRNEPGSNGQRDGAGKDRYFLHVYGSPADPAGTTYVLVDIDGDPTTVDPLTITDGNLQLHVSSCDSPPSFSATRGTSETPAAPAPVKTTGWGQLKLLYR